MVNMRNMIKKENRKKLLSLTLAAAMGFMTFTQQAPAFAADESEDTASDHKYVSEVYTAYGKDESSAEKELKDKGYTPVKGNLNQGASTYVMLGYKTTEDPKDAIHDLALMNSQGSYSIGEYENVLKESKNEIVENIKELMAMVKEYRACYEKKDGKAILAHEMLNNYIEDDSGMKMGDLLLEDTLQDKVGIEESIEDKNEGKLPDLVTIIMQGNGIHIKTIAQILGTATDSNEDGLVERTAETTDEDLKEEAGEKKPNLSEAKLEQYIKGQYDTMARGLAKEAVQLAKDFREFEKENLTLENASKKELEEKFDTDGNIENVDDLDNASKRVEWESTAALYDALKNYEGGKFKKGELLELIMNADENRPEDFYTMAASFTKGQKAAKMDLSLRQMLLEAIADEDSDEGTEKKIVDEEIKDIEEIKDVSVYDGVNREVFQTDGSVAMTDEALRNKTIAMPVDNSGEAFKTAFAIGAGVSWAATAYCFFKYLGKLDDVYENLEFYTGTYRPQIYGRMMLDETLDNVVEMGADQMVAKYGTLEKAYKELTKTSTVEGGAAEFYSDMYEQAQQFDKKCNDILHGKTVMFFKYATIALALISAGVTIAAFVYKKEAELPPVPKYIVDVSQDKSGKKTSLTYTAAGSNGLDYISSEKKNKGDYADTKAYEGRQWLTIYSTKDEKAGKPVRADIIVQDKAEAPKDYKGALHIIGEGGAQNLINSDYMNFSNYQKLKNKGKTVYMFYATGEWADSPAGAASSFSGGRLAIMLIAGIAILAALAAVLRRSRKVAKG